MLQLFVWNVVPGVKIFHSKTNSESFAPSGCYSKIFFLRNTFDVELASHSQYFLLLSLRQLCLLRPTFLPPDATKKLMEKMIWTFKEQHCHPESLLWMNWVHRWRKKHKPSNDEEEVVYSLLSTVWKQIQRGGHRSLCKVRVLQVEVRRALAALCSVTSSQHFLWAQYSLIQPRPSSVEPAVQRES